MTAPGNGEWFENKDDWCESDEHRAYKILQALSNFCVTVSHGIIMGKILLGSLYERYRRMEPCIHSHCNNERRVDINALTCALQRLPYEISRARYFHIQNKPENLSTIEGIHLLESGSKGARVRTIYEMGEGYFKCIALEGRTDIFDIVTSFIMYGIESGKIKKLLASDPLLNDIERLRNEVASSEKNQILCRLAARFSVEFEELACLDSFLRFGLFDLVVNIMENDLDRLEIEFASEFAETNYSMKARLWRRNLEECGQMHKSRSVMIVSSDLHNIVSCLTDFARIHKDRIKGMAQKHGDLMQLDLGLPGNLHYVLHRLCLVDADLFREKVAYEEQFGIRYVPDVHNTGIDVQVIDTFKLDPARIDPRINIADWAAIKERAPYIVNMRYAFGLQATEIMRELLEAFSTRIESISIIGKAGIVCGDRFDIMLPTYLIPQEIETGVHDFPNGNRLAREDFQGLVDCRVHTGGPMLTVPGIAIQNEVVLRYLMGKYSIQGLEMEGVPYVRTIRRAEKIGLLCKDILFCIGYWGSDNPLHGDELIARSHMGSGALSANALAVAVLARTLNEGRACHDPRIGFPDRRVGIERPLGHWITQ
jgi:hypothetical protein